MVRVLLASVQIFERIEVWYPWAYSGPSGRMERRSFGAWGGASGRGV